MVPQSYNTGAGGNQPFVTQFLQNINIRKNEPRSSSVPALGGGLSIPQTKRHNNAYGNANQVYGLEVTPNDSKSQIQRRA